METVKEKLWTIEATPAIMIAWLEHHPSDRTSSLGENMAAVALIVPIVSHAVPLKSPGPPVHCFVRSERFFRKVLSVDLPLTHRFVYILVSENFAHSES